MPRGVYDRKKKAQATQQAAAPAQGKKRGPKKGFKKTATAAPARSETQPLNAPIISVPELLNMRQVIASSNYPNTKLLASIDTLLGVELKAKVDAVFPPQPVEVVEEKTEQAAPVPAPAPTAVAAAPAPAPAPMPMPAPVPFAQKA